MAEVASPKDQMGFSPKRKREEYDDYYDKERDRKYGRDDRYSSSRDRRRHRDERERDRDRDRDREKYRDRYRDERDRDRHRDERDRYREDRERRSKSSERDKDRKKDRERRKDKKERDEKEEKKEEKPLTEEEEKIRKRREAWLKQKELLLKEEEDRKKEAMEKQEQELRERERKRSEKASDEAENQEEKIEDENNTSRNRLVDEEDLAGFQEEETVESSQSTNKEDEVDPLDAFMQGIEQQVVKKDKGQLANGSTSEPSKVDSKVSRMVEDSSEDEFEYEEESEEETSGPLKRYQKKMLAQVDHNSIQYISFRKNFYTEVPEIAKMTQEEAKIMRMQLEDIKVRGKDCPKPIKAFSQCGLSDKILKTLKKWGYEKPTPIQAQAIPAVMSGRDVIGCAKTGSGKTLAFLLPMLRHILDQPPLKQGDGMIGLVMAPTRELALQLQTEIKKFTKPLSLRCVCIYGGSGVANQIADLKRGAEIVVCTPGRMIDVLCANAGKVTNLHRVTYLVLDEADRMFDMGFEPQIMRIINNIRPDRQTLLFSATFPRQVEMLARKILVKPLEIIVGQRSVVCQDVEQHVEVMLEENKFKRLLELIKKWYDEGLILIFVDRQESADKLFADLMQAGYPCLSLHGGKDQQDRDFTIDDFKKKATTIMVATSIAARGLDVKDLILVINYDVPNHMEDYVHRVGRTGRAGAKGYAYTFITPDEDRYSPDIVKALEISKQPIPEALKIIYEAYEEKKAAGKAAPTISGYVGKGYKFDEEEEKKKEAEKKAQKKAYGIDEEEEEDYFDEEGEGTTTQQKSVDEILNEPLETQTSKGNYIQTPQQATQKVHQIALSITSKALKVSAATGDHFAEELEINDYPQQARWKVTHKDALHAITEWTGAAITTRGSYVPPGRNPTPGERKLYLFIEGPDATSVRRAKAEIKRILDETTAISGMDKPTYGRYSVI